MNEHVPVPNIQALKERYRVGSAPGEDVDCSVGGALCLEMVPNPPSEGAKTLMSWPPPMLIAEFLAKANEQCGELLLLMYATAIFNLNDEGKIDEAWETLEEALEDVS